MFPSLCCLHQAMTEIFQQTHHMYTVFETCTIIHKELDMTEHGALIVKTAEACGDISHNAVVHAHFFFF